MKSCAPTSFAMQVVEGVSWQIGDFYVAGQPTDAGQTYAIAQGIDNVVNLRSPGEPGFQQNEFSGLFPKSGAIGSYVDIPITYGMGQGNFDGQAWAVLDTITHGPYTSVLLHDSDGGRAAGLWALYLNVVVGLPIDQAIACGRECGLSDEGLIGYVKNYSPPQQP